MVHDSFLTLFNRHGETEENWRWYPVTLQGVTLHDIRANAPTADAGITNADQVEALISAKADRSLQDAAGNVLRYVGPKEYAALEDPAGFFTFTPGQDFFLVGSYEAEEAVADIDFDEGFYHALNRERDGVYRITSAAFYSLLPHFEIGGR